MSIIDNIHRLNYLKRLLNSKRCPKCFSLYREDGCWVEIDPFAKQTSSHTKDASLYGETIIWDSSYLTSASYKDGYDIIRGKAAVLKYSEMKAQFIIELCCDNCFMIKSVQIIQ